VVVHAWNLFPLKRLRGELQVEPELHSKTLPQNTKTKKILLQADKYIQQSLNFHNVNCCTIHVG
jgi:hypothetical protein